MKFKAKSVTKMNYWHLRYHIHFLKSKNHAKYAIISAYSVLVLISPKLNMSVSIIIVYIATWKTYISQSPFVLF